jgi:hypothetical protein
MPIRQFLDRHHRNKAITLRAIGRAPLGDVERLVQQQRPETSRSRGASIAACARNGICCSDCSGYAL